MMIGGMTLRRQSASKKGAEERINGLHQATWRLSPKCHGLAMRWAQGERVLCAEAGVEAASKILVA